MGISKRILIGTTVGVALLGTAGGVLAYGDGGKLFGFHHRGAGAMHMLERFDENKDGTVTRTEAESRRDKAVGQYDGDDSSTLSLKEFEGLWMEMTRQRMVRAFQRLDADGNGQVTKGEIDRPIAMMFGHLDRDGDGQIMREELRERGPAGRHRGPGGDDRGPGGGHR